MSVPAWQRSARCLLLALSRHGGHRSLPSCRRHLWMNDPTRADLFCRRVFTMPGTAHRSPSLPGAGTARSLSQDTAIVSRLESNLPSISPNPQEAASLPGQEMDGLSQELNDDPPESLLDVISEDEALQVAPIPPSSYTLRDYVDHSETLQKLVLLGVDLSKLEKRPFVGTFLLKLDFEKDINKILFFLKDVGVEDSQLGPLLTKNPFILTKDLETLQARVAYLSSKKFSKKAIARMVTRAPYLLNFSVERLDNRLGFFQNQLGISPENTRDLVTRLPRMITGSLEPVRENLKVFEIELGFRKNEIQHLALRVPKILTANKRRLTETFDYVHNTMAVPHNLITKFPQIFNTSLMKIKERHMFLSFLGRAIYDPKEPNYVSLDKLASMPDEGFLEEVAKASPQDFQQFQKTI